MTAKDQKSPSFFWLILITGLGFFIDSYDVFSFNVARVPSLTDLGLSGDALTRAGMMILNFQVIGSLAGGLFWGLLGDRIGRKKALFGSIIVYSLAMIASAFVHNVDLYAVFRFFVGFGIAGEVGLGATLVGESLSKEKRTFGLALFTLMGLMGVAAAAFSSEIIHWRNLYLIGGVAGLVLLLLRQWLMESKLFLSLPQKASFLLPLREIASSGVYLKRYVACIFLLAPSFFVTGFLLTLAPEFAKAVGIQEAIKPSLMLGFYFILAGGGDLIGALLTYKMQSRRKAMMIFLSGNLVLAAIYLYGGFAHSVADFYVIGALFGLFNVWALAATVSVEQFPTHLRATVSTSVMNFARASIVLFNLGLLALKPMLGTVHAAGLIGVLIIGAGLISAYFMRETYHADLQKVAG